MNSDDQDATAAPDGWRHLRGAVVILLVILALFVWIEQEALHAALKNQSEAEMSKLWWIIVPVLAVPLIIGGHWVIASSKARERQAQAKAQAVITQRQQVEARTEKGRREYVLEVIGLGVTVEKYRQGKLWDVLQTGSPFVSIREKDPKKYPWGGVDKQQTTGGREADTLENGAWDSVDCWGVPVFNAQPPFLSLTQFEEPITPFPGLVSAAESNGMPTHLFVIGPHRFDERPDRILDEIFAFFDANPDIPYVVFNADDSITRRNMFAPHRELNQDGYYVPAMPDASTLFVLARRERVDAIRPFVFEDVSNDQRIEIQNQEGISRRLYLSYLQLKESLPRRDPAHSAPRSPLINEWLAEAAKFGVRPDICGTGQTSLFGQLNSKHHPPADWKPTPWFPVPWETFQLATFDRMPTMGFIHRPVFVNTSDEHGKPLADRELRKKALLTGLHDALLTLPEAERAAAPARIIAGTNNHPEQLIALEGMLHDYSAQGGPTIDTGKLEQFINTDRRLGNTGAATWFVQMAIGVMGSYRAGGISAAINLRDPHEASIIFISPPSQEKRDAQQKSRGDIFRPRNSPAIDPANYAPPAPDKS
ncbi:MAG: DUF2875 family protein [Pseudomonadota bacterium]